MKLENIKIPTHKLILENSKLIENQGAFIASEVISQIHNHQDDISWNFRICDEMLKFGQTDVFAGSKKDCENKALYLNEAGFKYRIEEVD